MAVPLDKGEGANDDWKEEEAEGGLLNRSNRRRGLLSTTMQIIFPKKSLAIA
jgi:hypothetical protein